MSAKRQYLPDKLKNTASFWYAVGTLCLLWHFKPEEAVHDLDQKVLAGSCWFWCFCPFWMKRQSSLHRQEDPWSEGQQQLSPPPSRLLEDNSISRCFDTALGATNVKQQITSSPCTLKSSMTRQKNVTLTRAQNQAVCHNFTVLFCCVDWMHTFAFGDGSKGRSNCAKYVLGRTGVQGLRDVAIGEDSKPTITPPASLWIPRSKPKFEKTLAIRFQKYRFLNARARRENPPFEGCRDSVAVETACKRWILKTRSGVQEVSSSMFSGSWTNDQNKSTSAFKNH